LNNTFKRVANIIKDIDTDAQLDIDTNLLEDEAEKVLYDQFININNKTYSTFDEQLEALFSLKVYLDRFFDEVFVNHEDIKIKTNRKNLIGKIYQAFKTIADIKEITI